MDIDYEGKRDQLLAELKSVLGDAEKLLKEATDAPAEGLAALRARFEKRFSEMRRKIDRASAVVARQTRHAADATQEYVAENPWKTVGTLALAGLIVGLVLRRR